MKTTTIRKIAIKDLDLSPNNVRKATVTQAENEALEGSIAAHGLRQNLGVEQAQDGRFLVHSGGRRFNALCQLLAKGIIDPEYKVPCSISAADEAAELSLVENVMRAGMHPADEFEAFNRLIEEGATVEDVADRFGTTAKHVTQRMKLARVAPEIIALYREGEIRLTAVQAFALSDSHDRQREVYERVRPFLHYGDHGVYQIKNALTETSVSLTSRMGRFVGLEAYEAAAGAVTRDLFSDRDDVHLDDRQLVEKLALAKLEETATELRQAWRWVEVMIDLPFNAISSYGRVYPDVIELENPTLKAEWHDVEASLQDYEHLDDLTPEHEKEIDRLNQRWEEIDAAFKPVESYTDEAKAMAGCIVALDRYGDIQIEYGLIRPDDMPQAKPEQDAKNTDGDTESSVSETPEPALRVSPPRPTTSANGSDDKIDNPHTVALKDAGLSAALADDLRAIRHQITQAHLAADFGVAFDLMLYSMCKSAFASYYTQTPIDVRLTHPMITASRQHLEGTVAERMLSALKANLSVEWMNLPKPEDFIAMSALPTEAKQALFAFTASQGLIQQLSVDHKADPVFEHAGNRLAVDVAGCWRPTAENYFGRVTKDRMLKTARETISEAWSADHESYKKGQLAEVMGRAFSEEGQARAGLPQDKAAQTARWVPDGMGFSVETAAEPASADEALEAETPDTHEAVTDNAPSTDGDEDEESNLPEFLTEEAA